MKIAIDTCVGKRGRALLEHAGHQVVVEAEEGEMDHVWFARALKAGVELVVSADSDLEIHCYDHNINFFQAQQKHSGLLTAQRVLLRHPTKVHGTLRHAVAIAFRSERALLPPSDKQCSYVLEVFELGTGPIDTGDRHAVWLHLLKTGGYRWECSCGVQRGHHELDPAFLAEARAHFDQAWEPVAVPIWHPAAIWNDRATKGPPPSMVNLEQLAKELASEMK